MSMGKGWLHRSLLISIYALGVFGILASGDGSDGNGVRFFTCGLSIRGIAPVGDGTVWVGVFAKTNEGTEDRVVLLGIDGSEQFRHIIGDGGSENAIRAIVPDALGNIYVGGDFNGGILRLDQNGMLDMGFPVGTGFNGRVTTIVPLADGKVYVGGSFDNYDVDLVSGFVRLENNGTLDAGFGGNGATILSVESVAMAGSNPTDDVYSGGGVSPRIERWDDNGIDIVGYDPLLGAGSVLTVTLSDLPVPNAGDIYLGGSFGNRIIRLNNDGSPDGDFMVGTGFDANVNDIALALLNAIYVGGEFTNYNGDSSNGIVRIDSSGTRDPSLMVGSGFADPDDVFPFSKVASVAPDVSLDVFVGGGFTQYDGMAANGIVRLDPDGSLDPAFDVSITIDGEICDSQAIPD